MIYSDDDNDDEEKNVLLSTAVGNQGLTSC